MATRVVESIAALKQLVGGEPAVTDWLTVTQERIGQFAEATEDRQWIHVDPERAGRESPYGATIAHGFLTLSLLSWFMKQAIEVRGVRMGVNYGLNRVRFPAPVPAGSRIRAHVAVDSVKDFEGGCDAVVSFAIQCEGSSKPCCVGEWVVRFYAA
ncbi:MAG TPA: MaoC family dehydratase [Candidatus Acidoferrales bacterium]|nr:MaoC family dehydratase [Candidatus Acidoferrales bacterium]